MSAKGVIIDLKTLNDLIYIDSKDIKLENIQKFNSLNNYNITISKKEFFNIVRTFEELIFEEVLKYIDDTQEFILGLDNKISEFDAIAILKNDKKDIIFDIEIKNGDVSDANFNLDELKEKMDEQLEKKITLQLNQLFIHMDKIVVGFINNKFYKCLYLEDGKIYLINTIQEMKTLFIRFRKNKESTEMIKDADNLEKINEIFRKIEQKDFELYESSKDKLIEIKELIKAETKVIVCTARAGYGKTVLALKLFFDNIDNVNYKLLILNEMLYKTFGMKKYYDTDKAFFGSYALINKISCEDYIIIDEIQRLTKFQLKEIIKKAKCVILFGDMTQSYKDSDEFYSEDEFFKCLTEMEVECKIVKLKKTNRYDDTVDKAIRYMTTLICDKEQIERLIDFKLDIYYNSKSFLKVYENCQGNKRIFSLYEYSKDKDYIILKDENNNDTVYYFANRDNYSFSIGSSKNEIGNSFHAISFDVENCFVILKDLHLLDSYKLPMPKDISIVNIENETKYINELNVLFSRGRKSLHILVDDINSYLWFNQRKKDIYKK